MALVMFRDRIEPGHVTDVILESIADGVFTVDDQWRITSFNRAAEEITGISREDAIGQPCCEVFRASICEQNCALRRTVDTGKPIVNKAIYIVSAEGKRIPVSISTSLLRDEEGQVIGGAETFRDLSLVEELRKEIASRHTFADILSKNHEMQRLFSILPRVAESESTVLIQGESGTGKELFARAIHNLSPRRKKPFIAVNCGALPDTLLESELFGHKAGAFTDAKRDKLGRFALAKGGTLFLDEIGDVSPALQIRLLRVLQERTYEPLGATESIRSDVRIVAASNKDLAELVRTGAFRQDLFYRVNVVKLTLPPLRKRMDDVPLLAEHFIARFNRIHDKNIAGLSPEALRVLMSHDFPGNVRELENIIEHAFVLCDDVMIQPECLPDYLRPFDEKGKPAPASTLAEAEARCIYDALQRNHWNRSATARELGIHKTTLWRKIKQHGIDLPHTDGRSSSA